MITITCTDCSWEMLVEPTAESHPHYCHNCGAPTESAHDPEPIEQETERSGLTEL